MRTWGDERWLPIYEPDSNPSGCLTLVLAVAVLVAFYAGIALLVARGLGWV